MVLVSLRALREEGKHKKVKKALTSVISVSLQLKNFNIAPRGGQGIHIQAILVHYLFWKKFSSNFALTATLLPYLYGPLRKYECSRQQRQPRNNKLWSMRFSVILEMYAVSFFEGPLPEFFSKAEFLPAITINSFKGVWWHHLLFSKS